MSDYTKGFIQKAQKVGRILLPKSCKKEELTDRANPEQGRVKLRGESSAMYCLGRQTSPQC